MLPKHSYPTRNYDVGQLLFTLRSRAKFTQATLAAHMGIHRRSVQKWENGESYPTADNLRSLIALLLSVGAFNVGQEHNEAVDLWQRVSAAAPRLLPHFETAWFDQLLTSSPLPTSATDSERTTPFPLRDEQQGESVAKPRTLPFQLTSFVGRVAELIEIAKILAGPTCRLLTLLGPGGIGKTRLVLEVAAQQNNAFGDGVVFVPLAAVGTANQIVLAIGEALNLSFVGQTDPGAHLLGYLRTRHTLLILDNFEHLLAGADLVYSILTSASQVTILTTSRERLNLQAEWLFTVEGLSILPDDLLNQSALSNLTQWTDYSAVQLFVQRVTQIQSGLPPPEAALPTIVRICQHVAGMPLAIELAAAGVRTMPISEIEQQIRANLDVLATSLRDVPARHRSLRAAFDHSWNLMSHLEQALFCRLAVFRNGCTAAAAQQVAGATFSALTALIDKSLLRTINQETALSPSHTSLPTGSNATNEPRFGLLEPLREYASEKLALRGELESLQLAHATYYLALAETSMAQWDTPTVDAAINLLDREHDNLRSALRWARDDGAHLIGLQLAGALWRFWRGSGAINEGRKWLEELLALDTNRLDTPAMTARLRALNGAAWLASDQHDFTHAVQLFEQSTALRRALGESENETNLLINAARQARAAGEYRRATGLLEDTVARHRALGDRRSSGSAGLGLSLYELALVQREQGNFARASALYEECVTLHREIGDQEGLIAALLGLGDLARDQGDVVGIRKYSEESLAFFRELGIHWAIGFALNNLALAAYLEEDLPLALTLINESVSLFRGLMDDGGLAEALVTLGHILRVQGDGAAAYAEFSTALRLAQVVGPLLVAAAALEGMATALVQQEQAIQAIRCFVAAAHLRARMGAPVRPADQPALDCALASVRSTLGADTLAAIWREAQALSSD